MNTADRLNNSLKKELKPLIDQGIDPVIARYGEVDIAYPSDEQEYCLLGGYAVVMIVAISDTQDELPIERAYFQIDDIKTVPLDNLGVKVGEGDFLRDVVTEKKGNGDRTVFENISFWVIPALWFVFDKGYIAIDFKGERKNFSILRGPWKLHNHGQEWINKHSAGQLKVAEHVPFDVVAKFIDREFFKNNRVQV